MRWIRQTVLFLLVLLLLPAAPARADMGFSFLSNTNPQFRFENLSDYPDHDFYLKYGHSSGNPFSAKFVTPVTAGTPTQVKGEGKRLTPVVLIAVPHGGPVPSTQMESDWVVTAEPGTLQSEPLKWDVGGTALYRVRIEDGRLQAISRGTEWLSGNTWVGVIVGAALCAAVAFGGLFLVRRRLAARAVKKEA
jgi:hypothetical protein